LYIYNGNNREGFNVERDAGLERLAVKSGVEVVRVSGDWLRVMDKMSGGRPHNGYILEASPLPRRPVTSLGEFISTAGQSGFKISLDHQSREEAAVNGTEDFIKHSSNVPGRKPLVLLLDSIVDPGNLGGIIRTASFLGVSAIAVSTRNSASFTSVVLKASAGASECVTIFSVNKPAGFLVDSQAAGWKIYAAVSPTGGKDPSVPESIDADELADPLSENPCILVLGGEGDGLRRNLRSKADVDVSIRGSGRMDSLNVSVAAGILCNSFLRTRVVKVASGSLAEEAAVKGLHEPVRDLF
jgi:21S rRNA (GM2251-2'-O)-methyltransferase